MNDAVKLFPKFLIVCSIILILSGVQLARRRPFGFLFGTAMAVMGAVYQVNLMMAGVFGAAADVPGAKAFPPESVVLTTAFIIAAFSLLLGGRGVARRSRRDPDV